MAETWEPRKADELNRALHARTPGTPESAAGDIIEFWQRYVMDKVFDSPYGWECQNMLTVSLLMAQAARKRKESRGVHYRTDYPDRDDKRFSERIEFVCRR